MDLAGYLNVGKELGLDGKELQKYVTAQQDLARDERKLQREYEQVQRDYEREKEDEVHRRKLELLEAESKLPKRQVKGEFAKTPKLPSFDDKRDDTMHIC